MRFSRTLRTAVLIAGTMGAGACVEVFDPWGPEGFYGLRYANGERVPAVVYYESGNGPFEITLLGGELRLRADGTFRMDLDYAEWDGRVETRYTQGLTGEWDQEHDTVWLDYIDPETSDWTSLAANRRHETLEFSMPGVISGAPIRVEFLR